MIQTGFHAAKPIPVSKNLTRTSQEPQWNHRGTSSSYYIFSADFTPTGRGRTALTVPTGLSVFVIGQIASGLFVERINIQARTIEEIAQKLVIHAATYPSSYAGALDYDTQRMLADVRMDFRRLAALLSSSVQTLSWYPVFQWMRLVKTQEQVLSAARALIGLSNSLGGGESAVEDALDHRHHICEALGLIEE